MNNKVKRTKRFILFQNQTYPWLDTSSPYTAQNTIHHPARIEIEQPWSRVEKNHKIKSCFTIARNLIVHRNPLSKPFSLVQVSYSRLYQYVSFGSVCQTRISDTEFFIDVWIPATAGSFHFGTISVGRSEYLFSIHTIFFEVYKALREVCRFCIVIVIL